MEPTQETNNLSLWDKVKATDPKAKKHVNQRGGYTAIDSYYQIKKATELFGPIGIGWGYEADFRFQDDLAIAVVSLWYKSNGIISRTIPVCATNPYRTIDKEGVVKIDDDAAKKALTDAITKALSYLGFSADIFMEKFDSAKDPILPEPNAAAKKRAIARINFGLNAVISTEQMKGFNAAFKDDFDGLKAWAEKDELYKQCLEEIKARYAKVSESIKETEAINNHKVE